MTASSLFFITNPIQYETFYEVEVEQHISIEDDNHDQQIILPSINNTQSIIDCRYECYVTQDFQYSEEIPVEEKHGPPLYPNDNEDRDQCSLARKALPYCSYSSASSTTNGSREFSDTSQPIVNTSNRWCF